MKNITFVSFVVVCVCLTFSLLFLFITDAAAETWQPVPVTTQALSYYLNNKTPPLSGGEGTQGVRYIAFAPSDSKIVYMGLDTDNMWKSSDGGLTWQRKSRGFYANGVRSITVDPSNPKTVFVAGAQFADLWRKCIDKVISCSPELSPLGIYRSTDGGESWELVRQTLYVGPYRSEAGGNPIAFAGGTIYAGTDREGILKSTDGGSKTSWQSFVSQDVIGGEVLDLKVHPTNNSILYVSWVKCNWKTNIRVCSQWGIKKISVGSNGTATVSNLGASGLDGIVSVLLINPKDPNIIFAGDESRAIKRSTDGGKNFISSFTDNAGELPKQVMFMAMSPSEPNHVFVTYGPKHYGENARYDFYYTNNASTNIVTWQPAVSMDVQTPYGWAFSSLDADWVGRDSFMDFNGGPVAADPSNPLIALMFAGPGLIKRTEDGGKTWRYSNSGVTSLGGVIHSGLSVAGDKNNPAVMGIANTDRGLYFSFDPGNTTFSTYSLPNWPRQKEEGKANPDNRAFGVALGYGATKGVIVAAVGGYNPNILAVSKDSGKTWAQITTPDTQSNYDSSLLTFSPTNPQVVYAKNFRSDNAGTDWVPLSREVEAVYAGNGDIVYSIGYNTSNNVSIYKSIDKGKTWPQSSQYPLIPTTNRDGTRHIAVSPTNPDKIYFGKSGGSGPNGGVYIITNTASNGGTVVHKSASNDAGNGLRLDRWKNFNFRSIATDPNNSKIVYVVTFTTAYGHDDKTIFRSVDGGDKWEIINFNLNSSSINSLAVSPYDSYVYVNTWAGTWKLPPPGTSVDPTPPAAPGGLRVLK